MDPGLSDPKLLGTKLLHGHLILEISIPIKIPTNYFTDIDKLILQFRETGKRPRTANTTLKNKVGGMMLPTSRLIVIKTVWYQ